MRVSEVVYTAADQALLTSDSIRLKLTLEKNGVDMKSETFEGESRYMNGKVWLMQAEYEQVEADTLRVEAFNLDVDSHFLTVGDKQFKIPLTGTNETRTYRFSL
jgi:hypothetical protein